MNRIQLATLQLLYKLAREDRPADLSLLAAELGQTCVVLDRVLGELEKAGLADAERVRLTMAGLAVAASSRSVLRSRPRHGRLSSVA
ncbi:MAG: hypothetical protein HY908_20875 [Myxococcales bacterium]|nr:hypothetical protein [Myxococcales bacterium]